MKTNEIANESIPRTAHDLLPGDTAAQYKPEPSQYDKQALDFLAKNGIKIRITLSDSKVAPWETPIMKTCPVCEGRKYNKPTFPLGHNQTVWEDQRGLNKPIYTPKNCPNCKATGEVVDETATRHHYRVTLSREGGKFVPRPDTKPRLVFDFWGSVADSKAGIPGVRMDRKTGQYVPTLSGTDLSPTSFSEERALEIAKDASVRHPSAYTVLSCISSDIYTPDTFADFCAEYGYESDSIKALQTFRRCSAFVKRLRAFFTSQELKELAEIQ